MKTASTLAALAVAVLLGACVSAPKTAASPTLPPLNKTDSAFAANLLAKDRWSGQFRPMLQSTSNLGSGQQKLYGAADIVATKDTGFYHVTLSLDSQRGSEMLGWSVITGQCAKGGVLLMQPNALPPFEVRGGGRGELTADIALGLRSGEVYHVNLYQGGGNNEDAVIACALLRYSRR